MSKELDVWFQDQAEKIEHVDEALQSQNTKLDNLVVGMDAITKNVATAQGIQGMAASNNALVIQQNTICARIKNIERKNNISGPPSSPDITNTTTNGAAKTRPSSLSVESHKKQHKSLNKVCNTPNIIMCSQEQASNQKKELHPYRSKQAD
eukprot:15326696-Ditylum_brightwellii.AAC.2